MSMNKAINAVIAFIEDRPAQFKEILRERGSDVNLPAVQARLKKALNRRSATEIRGGLMKTLAQSPVHDNFQSLSDAYYAGVRDVETVFESLAHDLEAQ